MPQYFLNNLRFLNIHRSYFLALRLNSNQRETQLSITCHGKHLLFIFFRGHALYPFVLLIAYVIVFTQSMPITLIRHLKIKKKTLQLVHLSSLKQVFFLRNYGTDQENLKKDSNSHSLTCIKPNSLTSVQFERPKKRKYAGRQTRLQARDSVWRMP